MENLKESTPVLSAPQTFEGVKTLINHYKELGQEIINKTPGLITCKFKIEGVPLDVFREAEKLLVKGIKSFECGGALAMFATDFHEDTEIIIYSIKCKRRLESLSVSDYEPVLEEVAA